MTQVLSGCAVRAAIQQSAAREVERFRIGLNHCGYFVRDIWARPVRLLDTTSVHQPVSQYYETIAEAEALRDWLIDRAAGYPVNLVLADPMTNPDNYWPPAAAANLRPDGKPYGSPAGPPTYRTRSG